MSYERIRRRMMGARWRPVLIRVGGPITMEMSTASASGSWEGTPLDWNWVDLFVGAVALFGAYRGLRRGFVREGITLAGLAVGVWAAGRWQGDVVRIMEPLMGGGQLVSALAYLLVVLVALIAATLVTVSMDRFRRIPVLGGFDRVGGAVLGAAMGGVIALMALIAVAKNSGLGLGGAVEEARLTQAILDYLPWTLSHLPPELSSVGDFFVLPSRP